MEHEPRNEVLLVGRLPAEPEERQLPSGDTIVTFRLVVDRPPARKGDPTSRITQDTLACVARSAAARRTALSWAPGDVVEAEGSLRRRFWRAPGGPSSRYEVEVTRAKRLARAA